MFPSYIYTINIWLFLIANAWVVMYFTKLFIIYSIAPLIISIIAQVKNMYNRIRQKFKTEYLETSAMDFARARS